MSSYEEAKALTRSIVPSKNWAAYRNGNEARNFPSFEEAKALTRSIVPSKDWTTYCK